MLEILKVGHIRRHPDRTRNAVLPLMPLRFLLRDDHAAALVPR